MTHPRTRRLAVTVAAAAMLPLALSACSDDNGGDSGGNSGKADSSSKASASTGSGDQGGADSGTSMDKPFGSACSTVPKTGSGSFDGMAKDPVATAASHNPALSTLVSAVKKADLVDTLNNAQNLTVFAPTNDAFKKIPKATLDKVMNDKAQLTKILTYHVVGKKLAPKDLANGSFDTLEKSKLTTSGSGESYTVGSDSAHVVCGNVKTANATVYLIDSVLMPKS
ncbi:fasciclin domain-containing protein [Streptomyces sp. NPDC050560]|uniref:fasciclin domain-containing protein n=1 Tax=Streptomyces sp. NPDC050560 TaxID=3365630 RepID=UPI00379BCAA9